MLQIVNVLKQLGHIIALYGVIIQLLIVVNPELESYTPSNNLHLNLITSVSSQLC